MLRHLMRRNLLVALAEGNEPMQRMVAEAAAAEDRVVYDALFGMEAADAMLAMEKALIVSSNDLTGEKKYSDMLPFTGV